MFYLYRPDATKTYEATCRDLYKKRSEDLKNWKFFWCLWVNSPILSRLPFEVLAMELLPYIVIEEQSATNMDPCLQLINQMLPHFNCPTLPRGYSEPTRLSLEERACNMLLRNEGADFLTVLVNAKNVYQDRQWPTYTIECVPCCITDSFLAILHVCIRGAFYNFTFGANVATLPKCIDSICATLNVISG